MGYTQAPPHQRPISNTFDGWVDPGLWFVRYSRSIVCNSQPAPLTDGRTAKALQFLEVTCEIIPGSTCAGPLEPYVSPRLVWLPYLLTAKIFNSQNKGTCPEVFRTGRRWSRASSASRMLAPNLRANSTGTAFPICN